MSDVVEQGQRDGSGPPRWLRGGSLAVVAVVAVGVLTRSHLLSADEPTAHRPKPVPSAAIGGSPEPAVPVADVSNTSQGISIVVRQADQLRRYVAGSGVQPLATLPG